MLLQRLKQQFTVVLYAYRKFRGLGLTKSCAGSL
jgi:hypothetical protein